MSGPCLSSSVAGRPLRPATRHSLGEPLPHQLADRPRAHQEASCDFGFGRMSPLAICGINSPFGELSPTSRQIAHVLRTRSPLESIGIATNEFPFDLHVLSTPPAFVLSQNQTLRRKFAPPRAKRGANFQHHLIPQAAVATEGRSVIKLRLRKSTKNAQFSSYCFVYDPSGFRMLVRNRTCAIKDRLPVAAEGVSRPLLLPVCRGSRHGVVSTTSHLFECSRQTGEEHSRARYQSIGWDG